MNWTVVQRILGLLLMMFSLTMLPPVLVAIHGYCLGAGLEVAMMGDIRIASDDAKFALPEPKVGVSIDAGGDLSIEWSEGGSIRMTGPATEAFRGSFEWDDYA